MFNIKNIQISITVAMILLFVISMLAVFHLTERQIIMFLLYQIVLILIPGFAAALISKIKLPVVSMFCYSYALGYVINVFEYFAVKSTENYLPIFVIPLIILLISVIVIFKKKNDFSVYVKNSCSKEQLTTLSFLALLLFLNIFVFSLSCINIEKAGHDFLWWCANSVSLKLGFPPEYVFMKGVGLYYHYFSNVQIAFFNLISNVDIRALSIPLYSLTKTIMMVGAVDFALNILKIKDAKIKAFVFTLVLLTTGFEKQTLVTYFHHIFFMPFGYDIGFALGFIYTALLTKQFYDDKFDIKNFIPTIMVYFVCAGAKSPVSHVLLALTGLICLYWLVKKQFASAFLYGLTVLGTCFFVSFYFVGAGKVLSETSNTWRLSGFHTLAEYGPNHSVLHLFGRILSVNPALSIMTVLSILAIVVLFVKRIKFQKNDLSLMLMMLLTSFTGTALWIVVNVGGNSEMYYEMASFIPLVFFILIAFKTACENSDVFTKKQVLSYKIIALFGLIFGIVLMSFCAYAKNGMIRTLSRNLKKNISYREKVNDIKPLLWIKNNAPTNTIVLADNLAIKKDKAYYIYGIITERRQYLEEERMLTNADEKTKKEIEHRKQIIKGVFANDENTLKQLKNEDISYVISTCKITPDFEPDKKYLKLVASSKKFKVYKVK